VCARSSSFSVASTAASVLSRAALFILRDLLECRAR
jgi:hypothetical protein